MLRRCIRLNEAITKRRKVNLGGKEWHFSYANVSGHASFVLLATSYLESDPLHLRMLAMAGFGSMSVFQYFRPQPLWLPLRWNAIFIAINFGMSARLIAERERAKTFQTRDEELYQRVFAHAGVSRPDFMCLLDRSELHHVRRRGEKMATQNATLDHLSLILTGEAQVVVNGKQVAVLKPDQFFGEMSFIAYHEALNDETRATVTAKADVLAAAETMTLLVWKFDDLVELLNQRPALRNTFYASVASDLMRKITRQNEF